MKHITLRCRKPSSLRMLSVSQTTTKFTTRTVCHCIYRGTTSTQKRLVLSLSSETAFNSPRKNHFKANNNNDNNFASSNRFRHYYPTALRRVQITPKSSTNITRYLYSRGPVRLVFSQRASDELDWSYEKNFFCQNEFLFYVFSWQKSLSETLELMCNLDDRKTIFSRCEKWNKLR